MLRDRHIVGSRADAHYGLFPLDWKDSGIYGISYHVNICRLQDEGQDKGSS